MLGERFTEVLSAAQTGGEWAWHVLYRDLSGQLLGYVRAQRAVEPEDLVGEVFCDLARNIGTFTGDESSFRSWVFTIAHHRVIDERRYRSRRPNEPTDSPEEPSPAGDVEEEALASLISAEIQDLLARLTPDQRHVLLLRILGGLTLEETARVVGKRVGAVKALQHRGVIALRKLLANRRVSL
ncbi:MAG: RNA polymerase sigma factor [Acidimicrobiia bacterium]